MDHAKKVEDLRNQRVATFEALLLANEAFALERDPTKRKSLLARSNELRNETGRLMVEHSKAIKEYRAAKELDNVE